MSVYVVFWNGKSCGRREKEQFGRGWEWEEVGRVVQVTFMCCGPGDTS